MYSRRTFWSAAAYPPGARSSAWLTFRTIASLALVGGAPASAEMAASEPASSGHADAFTPRCDSTTKRRTSAPPSADVYSASSLLKFLKSRLAPPTPITPPDASRRRWTCGRAREREQARARRGEGG